MTLTFEDVAHAAPADARPDRTRGGAPRATARGRRSCWPPPGRSCWTNAPAGGRAPRTTCSCAWSRSATTRPSDSRARPAAHGSREDEAAAVAARAGGNPFFIVESTGALIRVHERGEPRAPSPILPPTVQAMIAARLDALPATLRDVARRLSVYMYSFDLDEAELVAECGVDGMGELVDAEIVVRDERSVRARPRGASATTPCATSRTPACRSACAPRCTSGSPNASRRAAINPGPQSIWRPPRRRRMDIDPDRPARCPNAPRTRSRKAGDRARRRMESRSAIDYYDARARDRARRRAAARGAGAGGRGRGALLARRVSGGDRRAGSRHRPRRASSATTGRSRTRSGSAATSRSTSRRTCRGRRNC